MMHPGCYNYSHFTHSRPLRKLDVGKRRVYLLLVGEQECLSGHAGLWLVNQYSAIS
jgi:hypothetical protein